MTRDEIGMTIPPRRAWSVGEVAQQLGVEYHVVMRMIRADKITAFRVGRYYRISDTELERLLHSGANTA